MFSMNNETGAIVIDGFTITPDIKKEDLPCTLVVEKSKNLNHCYIAHYKYKEGILLIDIKISFNNTLLSSVCVKITDTSVVYKESTDFYSLSHIRERLHNNWLNKKMKQVSNRDFWQNISTVKTKCENYYISFSSNHDKET